MITSTVDQSQISPEIIELALNKVIAAQLNQTKSPKTN